MRLKYITFTGPDDRTDIDDLLDISLAMPQVEWGVLLSSAQAGKTQWSARFPSHAWLKDLQSAALGEEHNFAGHLCGRYVRDMIGGEFTAWRDREEFDIFQRFQLNFHGEPIPEASGLKGCLQSFGDSQFIFQMDGVNEAVFHDFHADNVPVVPLFDQSHGEGVLPDSWPALVDGVLCGFAGGLGPDNLHDQLAKLADHVGDETVWVDMETRIRNDDDLFDLDMVKRCIDIAIPYF